MKRFTVSIIMICQPNSAFFGGKKSFYVCREKELFL